MASSGVTLYTLHVTSLPTLHSRAAGTIDLRPHRCDRRSIILRSKNPRSRHERVCTGTRELADVVDFHASVDLQADLAPARENALLGSAELRQRGGNEPLPAEAWIDRHEQGHVELVHHVIEPVERRRRIEHQPRLTAVLANEIERAIDVLACFRVK